MMNAQQGTPGRNWWTRLKTKGSLNPLKRRINHPHHHLELKKREIIPHSFPCEVLLVQPNMEPAVPIQLSSPQHFQPIAGPFPWTHRLVGPLCRRQAPLLTARHAAQGYSCPNKENPGLHRPLDATLAAPECPGWQCQCSLLYVGSLGRRSMMHPHFANSHYAHSLIIGCPKWEEGW